MCQCCKACLETIWWHLIEKRFCYDESIALYEVPEKPEKNNNMFENMAFFDSVSVIAGRSVVTIDHKPEKKLIPIIQQPRKTSLLQIPEIWQDRFSLEENLSKSAPDLVENHEEEDNSSELPASNETIPDFKIRPGLTETRSDVDLAKPHKNSLEIIKSAEDLPSKTSGNLLTLPKQQLRKQSLLERRISKSLYLKIECVGDHCKEIPIIRQSSVPKFYLGPPEDHQMETAIFRTPSMALTSPIPATNQHGFVYDLSSVVQMEKEKAFNELNCRQLNDRDRRPFKDKIIKLRRIKSTMSAIHSHHM